MEAAATANPFLSEESVAFYRHALAVLTEAGVPHMVGGAYALARYTGIERHTKDFDLFIKREDFGRAAEAFRRAGYRAELTFEHWIGKAFNNGTDDFVDLIYSAGNAVAEVDDEWFERAVKDQVFGVDVLLIPAEEMIWSKGLIAERERFDGADICHVIHAMGEKLDWKHILERYADHWRVLYAHIVLYGFIYPARRDNVPAWVVEELTQRLLEETRAGNSDDKRMYGTIISRQQYLIDVNEWGYHDARLQEHGGRMSAEEIDEWTKGIAIDGAK